MLLQAKNHKKNRKGQFFRKNRKGVSIMVGYVLLVVFAIILSVIVYQWIKTYVPSDPLQCPDNGVSVSIKAVSYDCGANTLYLLIKNNGRFNILGYFAHAANVSGQEVATIELSQYFQENVSDGEKFGNSIALISAEQQNIFKPGDEKVAIFNLIPTIMTSIQITPTRLQEVNNKNRFISCGNEKVEQEIYCGMDTRIEDVCKACGVDYQCGGPWSDGCEGILDCGDCPEGQSCDALGQCYSDDCDPDPNVCSGLECGFATNGTCGDASCGECNIGEGEICVAGICTTLGNGVCDPEETCADEPVACEGQQASDCLIGYTCQSGICVFSISGGPTGCSDYCALFEGYVNGGCRQNPIQCTPGVYMGDIPGANASIGDGFCEEYGGPTDDTCCCYSDGG
jgi:hypothetical protein